MTLNTIYDLIPVPVTYQGLNKGGMSWSPSLSSSLENKLLLVPGSWYAGGVPNAHAD